MSATKPEKAAAVVWVYTLVAFAVLGTPTSAGIAASASVALLAAIWAGER